MAKLKQKGKGSGPGSGHKIEKSKKSAGKFKSKKDKLGDVSHKKGTAGKKSIHQKKKPFTAKKHKPSSENKSNQPDKEEGNVEMRKDGKRKLPSSKENLETQKKGKNDVPDVVKRLKAIGELLRRKSSSKEDKHKLIDEVITYITDKENLVVFKHDTVRVLEHCMKSGSDKQREQLFELFKEKTIILVSQTYSKFLVEKFMVYGTKEQRGKIISSFYGKVRKLMKQKNAADIMEELYAKHANSVQRASLVEEFYGPEFTVFKIATGQTFEDLIENEPTKKELVLDFMKSDFLNLCQKDTILYSIAHKALLDFFKYANDSQKAEVHEVLKERVVHILHTKEGAKVAMNCLWLATTKDRKAILKSFKTFVLKICKEEYGHLVMLSLFDVMDDTVLVKKAIFPEILSNIEDLVADQYGRKVILYLLKPRCHSYFLPETVKILEQGDSNVYSKKTAAVRQEELRNYILPELLKSVTGHVDDIMKNKSVAIVLLAAIECAADSPELISLFEKIAGIISVPLKKESATDVENEKRVITDVDHPVCGACGHYVLKKIIENDKTRSQNGSKFMFSDVLCNNMPVGGFADWGTFNRGAFVLVSLLQSDIESVTKRVKGDLTPFPKNPNSELSSCAGIELLHKYVG